VFQLPDEIEKLGSSRNLVEDFTDKINDNPPGDRFLQGESPTPAG